MYVRRESDGRLSWRGPSRERRFGLRLDGKSSWRFGGQQEVEEQAGRADSDQLNGTTLEERGRNVGTTDDGPLRVGIRSLPGPVSADVRARLYDALERHLDELAFGLMERDRDRIFALWGGQPDAVTRSAVDDLLARYTALRVWTRPLAIDVGSTSDGPEARFEVVVTIQGAPKGARNQHDIDVRNLRWRGRLGLRGFDGNWGDPVQLDPLSD